MLNRKSIFSNYSKYLNLFSILLLLSICLTGCQSQRTIVNNVDEKEANEILVLLASRGIDAYKVQAPEAGGGGAKIILWNIAVAEENAKEAMSILIRSGLPRRQAQTLLGIFQQVGLVPSELQEKIRYQAGLAEQIAGTIRKIDGILDAEVQLSIPEEDPLRPEEVKNPVTASVYVKHSGILDDPNSHLIPKIKQFVAGSVSGLNFDNVTVVTERTRYTGLPFAPEVINADDKEYVSIWSIIIAKESAGRFRLLFFSFTIIILLLIIFFIWIGWKVFPVIQHYGGFKSLMNLSPILPSEITSHGKEKSTEETKQKESEEAEEIENVQEEPLIESEEEEER